MRTKRTMLWLVVLGVVSCGNAAARSQEEKPSHDQPWSLLGDHTPDGVEISATWIGEYTSIISGGIHDRGGARYQLRVDAKLDLETILGIDRTTFFAEFLNAEPGNKGGSPDAGDIQGFSNIEIYRSMASVYQIWIQHQFDEINLRLKVGKVDANTEFDAVDILGGFANSSAGYSPTIFVLPTYSDPAFSVNLIWSPSKSVTLKYGLYDGAIARGVHTGSMGPSSFFDDIKSNDLFHIAQLDLSWDAHHGGGLSLGAWHHTGSFTRFDGSTTSGASGIFATMHQALWRDGDSSRMLSVGLQYGHSDPELSAIEQHIGVGLVMHQPIASRSDDEAGIYWSQVDLSDAPGSGHSGNESVIDCYYAITLNPNVTLRPQFQYIINPSGNSGIQNATVLGLRMIVSF